MKTVAMMMMALLALGCGSEDGGPPAQFCLTENENEVYVDCREEAEFVLYELVLRREVPTPMQAKLLTNKADSNRACGCTRGYNDFFDVTGWACWWDNELVGATEGSPGYLQEDGSVATIQGSQLLSGMAWGLGSEFGPETCEDAQWSLYEPGVGGLELDSCACF